MNSGESMEKIRKTGYHETKRHTDTMFAFNVYPCTIPTDFPFVPLHWQDSVEIIYVKRGKGMIQIDFETFDGEKGDIFLALPGHLHGLRGLSGSRMEYENIIFDMELLENDGIDVCGQKYLRPLADGKIQVPRHIGAGQELHSEACRCLDAIDGLGARRPRGYELGIKGYLMILFSALIREAPETKSSAGEDRSLRKLKLALSMIEENYSKKLTVSDVAARCGYSASHFMRWFREATGSGFTAYLIEFRLGKAARALRDTSDTVLEIASQTGFDNLSNFNRLFKKRFGMTPSQFRSQKV